MADLKSMTTEFLGRLSVAVWIGRISDEAACEALRAYSAACEQLDPARGPRAHEAILAEYRHWREGQDLCS